MKTLELHDGDLRIGTSRYATISGPRKVVQDLRCALLEPVGNDRFHPSYGSQLEDFIGLPLSPDVAFLIQQEIARVVQNYAAVQRDQIQRDLLAGLRARYTAGDVLAELVDVKVEANFDTVSATVTLRTLDANTLVLNASVGV